MRSRSEERTGRGKSCGSRGLSISDSDRPREGSERGRGKSSATRSQSSQPLNGRLKYSGVDPETKLPMFVTMDYKHFNIMRGGLIVSACVAGVAVVMLAAVCLTSVAKKAAPAQK